MGPLVTREHRDRVASYLDGGAAQGAEIVVDGREHALYRESEGFFLGVSLIDRVEASMDCYRDEIFGPVLEVMRVPTYADAVRLINENPYGNGTAIFTRDGGAARQFQFEVEAGMVGINVPIPVPVAYYSFGGWKASLFGDSHMYGPEGDLLLHPGQGRHGPLARPGHLEGRPGLPAHEVGGGAAPRPSFGGAAAPPRSNGAAGRRPIATPAAPATGHRGARPQAAAQDERRPRACLHKHRPPGVAGLLPGSRAPRRRALPGCQVPWAGQMLGA